MTLLPGVLPELQAGARTLEALAAARGLAFTYNREKLGGYVRSAADTAAYMAYRDLEWAIYAAAQKARGRAVVPKLQWRPISPFGASFHNYGGAFDVTMVRGTLAELGALAPAAGLKWGGSPSFVAARRRDDPHFQVLFSLLEAKAKWLRLGNAPGALSAKAQAGLVATVLLVGAALATVGRWKL